MSAPLLSVQNAIRRFGTVTAVDDVSLDLHPGRVVAIVGASGSGKSTLANLILGLDKPDSGAVHFEGRPLASLDRTGRRAFRAAVQMVFQDPFASLNPRMTVAQAVSEPLVIHGRGTHETRRERTLAALDEAELRPAEAFLHCFPHELSGGQRQRVAIARAIVLSPQALVADEPVSMLDVSVRAGILRLLRHFSRDRGMALAFITHDLSLISALADDVAVMHRGRIVEWGTAGDILAQPQDPYTQRLIAAVPRLSPQRQQ